MTTNYQITPPDIRVQPIMHNKSQTRYNSANSKWASPISGILNDDELRLEQEKLEKSKRLEQRRAHLSTILEADKNKFQTELTSQRRSSHESIVQINNPIDPLYSTYEYSYQPEITINSDLQSIELSRTDYLVEEQEDKQSERKRRHQQLKVILQQQMEEFNRMEEEADILNQEEERWYQKQQRLEQFQEQRKQMEENYPIQQNHGRQLLRQHKAKLHKRLKEIQERLQLDIDILISIVHSDEEESEEQQQRQQLKQNASHLLEQFQQQMKIEKNKEKELDAMYPEDAAKQWSRYDQQWNDDQQLRLKLLRPILNERQNQLIQQLHLFKQQQKDIYEKQRLLIDDMEQARKYDLIEKQKMLVIQKEPVQSIVYDEPNHPIEQIIPQEILIPPTDSKFYGRRRFNWN